MDAPAPRGRGAADNPPNRFQPLSLVRDEWMEDEDPDPGTTYLRDDSRTIIARNSSPDVGFETSLNPYRGCLHGCVYCLGGETPILMGDGSQRALEGVRVGDVVYGTLRRGPYRRYVRTRVLAHWSVERPAYRIRLADGTTLVAGRDHRFLTGRGWKFVTGSGQGRHRRPHLTLNDRLLGVGRFAPGPWPDVEYARGYLCGVMRGDGSLRSYRDERPGRKTGDPHAFRLAMADRQALVKALGGLQHHLRFFHAVEPTIARKRDLEGRAVKGSADLRVVEIAALGRTSKMYDITTGTGDFIADGVVSHNCYARPTHEYFGLSAGLDFESKIFVKERAPELLRAELASPRWTPQTLVMSGVTDPYQPVERRLRITRRCLEVLAEFRNPVAVITKGELVARDADVLAELAADRAAAVTLSVTTLDAELARRMEPRASAPARRLLAIERLAAAGVPVGVNVAPVIPGLNDHELPAILAAAAAVGASSAGWILLRLPHGVADLFDGWLERHFPERRGKVLGRIREVRGGRRNDPRFGSRMRGEGEYAEHLARLFRVGCRKAGLAASRPLLSTAAFRVPTGGRGRGGRSLPSAPEGPAGSAPQLDFFG